MVDAWNQLGAQRGGQPGHVLALTVHSDVLNWAEVNRAVGRAAHAQGTVAPD